MTKPIRLEHLQPCVGWWGGLSREGRVETEVAWKMSAEAIKERGYNLDVKNPHEVLVDDADPEALLAQLSAREAVVRDIRERLKSALDQALLH